MYGEVRAVRRLSRMLVVSSPELPELWPTEPDLTAEAEELLPQMSSRPAQRHGRSGMGKKQMP
jgi:hypothetical protein